jgi:hypothetical protein
VTGQLKKRKVDQMRVNPENGCLEIYQIEISEITDAIAGSDGISINEGNQEHESGSSGISD